MIGKCLLLINSVESKMIAKIQISSDLGEIWYYYRHDRVKNWVLIIYYKNGALDSQPQVIKFTSCLAMVGGSLRVLRLPPPLKLVAMI
jgi:hypothetical protein